MIILNFTSCTIDLYDVPEAGISVNFATYNNGAIIDADYRDIVAYEAIDNYNPIEHIDFDIEDYSNPKDITKRKLRNLFKNLKYYHLGFIEGTDYS